MADTLSSRIDSAQGEAIEEDAQWWANRFRYVVRPPLLDRETDCRLAPCLVLTA